MASMGLFLTALLALSGTGQAVPPPPERVVQPVPLAQDNCPLAVHGMAVPYAPAGFEFDAARGNVLLIAIERPTPELVFEVGLADGANGAVVSGAGFGEGDVRVALPESGRYVLRVHVRGDFARTGVRKDFALRLFLRKDADAVPCASGTS